MHHSIRLSILEIGKSFFYSLAVRFRHKSLCLKGPLQFGNALLSAFSTLRCLKEVGHNISEDEVIYTPWANM
jgi:hypothetical protein